MKRAICIFLAFLILSAPVALAADDYTVQYGAYAENLWDKGLFQGTGTSFDLDKPLTRVAGVTMMVRLLGREAEAGEGGFRIPFKDVPNWALGYVGYAYENGLTNGTGETTFSSDAQMTATQFLTMVLRALGYDDSKGDFSWDKAEEKAIAIGLTKGGEFDRCFLRDHAAYISLRALDIAKKGTSTKLGDTITMPGQSEKKIPSPTAKDLPTGYIKIGAYEKDIKKGGAIEVGVALHNGNSTGFKATVSSSDKTIATVKWNGNLTRGSEKTTGKLVITGVSEGSCQIWVRAYNRDQTMQYYNCSFDVVVYDAEAKVTPSPAPTPTPTPAPTIKPTPVPTPVPTADPGKLPFSLKTSGSKLYVLPGSRGSMDYWMTGAKGYTVEVDPPLGESVWFVAPAAPVYNSTTGVSSGTIYLNGFNDTAYTKNAFVDFIVKDASGGIVRKVNMEIAVAPSLQFPTSLSCMFGDTYKVEVGQTGDGSVKTETRITPLSLKVFIEDESIAEFIDAQARHTYNASGQYVFNGYFDLYIKGLRQGSTKAIVYTCKDGDSMWEREEFTIKVAAAGSTPLKCPLCEGKEICPYCFGQGYNRNPLDATDKWPCVTCGGTGVCPVCHGTGLPR